MSAACEFAVRRVRDQLLLLLVLLVACLLPGRGASAANLAPNAGFESQCGSAPCNWSVESFPPGGSIGSSTTAHTGTYSGVATANSTFGNNPGIISDCILLATPANVLFNVWYNKPGASTTEFLMTTSNYSDAACTTITSSTGVGISVSADPIDTWHFVSRLFHGGPFMRISLRPLCSSAPCSMRFDDVVFGVPPLLTLSPSSLPNATVAAPYTQTLTASGGVGSETFAVTAGNLPAGLALASNGILAGTPTAGGVFNFTVTATDSNLTTGSRDYSLSVNAPTITLSPATLPAATVAAAYNQTITASGGTSPYTFAVTAGALPAGLSLSTAGALTGTLTAGGTFTFTVTATDSTTGAGPYTGSQTYSLTVNAPTITVSPATLPAAAVAAAYSQTITASGGTSPYTFALTAGALPAGLSLSSAGALSGTPTAGGTFTFTVTATDSTTGAGPYTGSRAYTLSVNAATITVAPASLPPANAEVFYTQTITASGGTSPYSFARTAGSLPSGLTLSSSGVLSGTATVSGTFTFTVTATDSSTGTGPYAGSRTYSLTVNAPTITVSPASLPAGTAGNSYSQTITASGGVAPFSFNVTGGSLPAGLTLTTGGLLAGTTTTAGTFNFTITASDANHFTGSASYTVNVGTATTTITLTATPNPAASGSIVTFTATITGANPTGTVTFFDRGNPIAGCAGIVLVNGVASCSALLAPGSHSITATYSGDSNNAGATSLVLVETVNPSLPIPALDGWLLSLLIALLAGVALRGVARRRR